VAILPLDMSAHFSSFMHPCGTIFLMADAFLDAETVS
jgi:hypothetical protein